MDNTISIQIHDYDKIGRYLIQEEREVSMEEAMELKKQARKSVKVDWDILPSECTHIVYYAELLNDEGEVWYAAYFMHGQAYDEYEFDRTFYRKDIGYVGAIHKRINGQAL